MDHLQSWKCILSEEQEESQKHYVCHRLDSKRLILTIMFDLFIQISYYKTLFFFAMILY